MPPNAYLLLEFYPKIKKMEATEKKDFRFGISNEKYIKNVHILESNQTEPKPIFKCVIKT